MAVMAMESRHIQTGDITMASGWQMNFTGAASLKLCGTVPKKPITEVGFTTNVLEGESKFANEALTKECGKTTSDMALEKKLTNAATCMKATGRMTSFMDKEN